MVTLEPKPGGAAKYTGSFTKFVVVYIAILILAGLQFVIAYQHISGTQMFHRMLSIALVEAGLAVMFFMHLGSERRSFVAFVGIFIVFVLAAMQYSWTDSFRMLKGAAPHSNYESEDTR
jgi:cytochrome c oxidase subunit IV